jgi:hypothetical protein
MREREAQQIFFPEFAAEAVLKCGKVGHGF